jgi:hypothetical protein
MEEDAGCVTLCQLESHITLLRLLASTWAVSLVCGRLWRVCLSHAEATLRVHQLPEAE